MPALTDLMQPYAVNARVSRLKVINTTLQKALGFGFSGGNVKLSPTGRRGVYDVFNETREVPTLRMPNASAATVARQRVGSVGYVVPRSAEKVPLLLDDLANLRPIGGPVDQIDDAGERYIADQERILKQRFTNLREFQCAAFLRGSYTFTSSGEDYTQAFSGGSFTVDYQMPSGNKNQLNMLGAGDIIGTSWANNAAQIVGDCLQVNAALIELTGRGLRHIYCTSVVWHHVIRNNEVQSLAGAVNTPFKEWTRDDSDETMFGRLVALPGVTWHINDNGVSLSGTFTKLIGDSNAVFTTELSPEIASYYECVETVVDWVGRPPQPRQGAYYWAVPEKDPARYDLYAIHNGLPVSFIPSAICYSTCVF